LNIGIDLKSAVGEKTGKGFYAFNIAQNLLKIDSKNNYFIYAPNKIAGFEHFKNCTFREIKSSGIFYHLKTAMTAKRDRVEIFLSPSSYILPLFLSKKTRIITTVHDLVAFLFKFHNKKAKIIEKICLKWTLKKSDTILAVSSSTKKDLLDHFKVEPKKIKVVYCSASEEFKPVNKEGLKDFIKKTNLPEKFFLSVGTLEPRKNHVNLIKAFAHISKKYSDQHLIIVGKEGWGFEEIYKEVERNNLKNSVHFLGYLSGKSLVSLYNLAEAFVFPSIYEGFGIPPLEAMKCGCPVIVSNNSSLPEVVADAGILVKPEDVNSIALAMEKIIRTPELREEMIKKGLSQSKKFSWEKSSRVVLNLFQDLR
jgi:glycosyltransferase involved in cell wall biosynthesis